MGKADAISHHYDMEEVLDAYFAWRTANNDACDFAVKFAHNTAGYRRRAKISREAWITYLALLQLFLEKR